MIDALVALFFALGFPFLTWPVYNRRRSALQDGNWGVKRREYAETIGWLSSMGLAPILLWIIAGRDLDQLGLGIELSWEAGISLLIVAALIYVLVNQVKMIKNDAVAREAVKVSMAPESEYLPSSLIEAPWFFGVSLAAGVGEEIFYRGFLLWFLALYISLPWAIAISTLLFGFAHVMHGVRSMIRASVSGVVLVALYLFSGMLWPSIFLHIAIDVSSGKMGLVVFAAQEDAH